VIVLSEIFYPETTSTGYYLTAIAAGLARSFSVEAICSAPAGGQRLSKMERYCGVLVRRFGRMNPKDATIGARLFGASVRALRMGLWLTINLNRRDIVLITTNPPLLPLVAAIACLLKRASFVLLVHDVYPMAAVVAGVLKPDSACGRLWHVAQRRVLRQAAHIIVLGRDMRGMVARMEPAAASKTVVIPNWAETDTVRVIAKIDSPFARENLANERFVALCAGNLGRTHDLGILLEAARLAETDRYVLFLIAATGSQYNWFVREVSRNPCQSLRTVPLPLERGAQTETLAAADVVIITFKPGMAGVSVPSRMYNAMAAGKPIVGVTDDDSELALVIREEGIGWVVSPGDADALWRVIAEARAQPERLREMGLKARCVAETKYSPDKILGEYRKLFDSIAAATPFL